VHGVLSSTLKVRPQSLIAKRDDKHSRPHRIPPPEVASTQMMCNCQILSFFSFLVQIYALEAIKEDSIAHTVQVWFLDFLHWWKRVEISVVQNVQLRVTVH